MSIRTVAKAGTLPEKTKKSSIALKGKIEMWMRSKIIVNVQSSESNMVLFVIDDEIT